MIKNGFVKEWAKFVEKFLKANQRSEYDTLSLALSPNFYQYAFRIKQEPELLHDFGE